VPSDNTGKYIRDILVQRKQVVITFEDESTVTLSERGYTQFYLYPKKRISDKEYAQLKEAEALDPFHSFLIRLLARGRYSEAIIRQKLYARKAQRYQVEELVKTYREYGLINDQALLKELTDYYREQHLGYRAIQRKLKEKGFSETLIKAQVKPLNEGTSMHYFLPFLEKKYAHLPHIAKRQKLYQALVNKGFDHDTISTVIDAQAEEDLDVMYPYAKRVFDTAYAKYKRTLQGNALNERLINFMRTKGYTMNTIKQLLGEKDHDEREGI
jgi:SOS response regulatory protein OraA/RecX